MGWVVEVGLLHTGSKHLGQPICYGVSSIVVTAPLRVRYGTSCYVQATSHPAGLIRNAAPLSIPRSGLR